MSWFTVYTAMYTAVAAASAAATCIVCSVVLQEYLVSFYFVVLLKKVDQVGQ